MSEPTHPASKPGAPPAGAHGDALPEVDVRERGAPRDGQPQWLDRRLFMQLLVFTGTGDPGTVSLLGNALTRRGITSVIYHDVNDPRGLGLLSMTEDPAQFVTAVRPAVTEVNGLVLRPEFTMIGRTYSTGYEQDLPFWLLQRPRETVLNESWPWAVWYPLRRSGAFSRLDPREQGAVLREHGVTGRAYGAQDLAHDVRLASQGLDTHDNDFTIGLIGKDLYPLSHVVQAMRKTRQTSEFIVQMGPFFVGHVAWRSGR